MPLPTDFSSFLLEYGYVAVMLGTFLEGETILLLAGFFAHQGYMQPVYVALSAFCGSFASDQLLFLIARYKGEALLRRFPKLAAGVTSMSQKMHRHEILLILSFRFIYGLRNITPAFLGLSGVHPWLYSPLNALSAAAWAIIFTAGGYYAGEALTSLFGKMHKYEPYILAGGALLALILWFLRRKILARKKNPLL